MLDLRAASLYRGRSSPHPASRRGLIPEADYSPLPVAVVEVIPAGQAITSEMCHRFRT